MRIVLIIAMAATAACGNGMVQLDQIVPFDGLDPSFWQDKELGSEWTAEGASHEVDTAEGYCISTTTGSEGVCTRESLGPHYAALLVSNHNEEPEIDGITGTAQLDSFSVDIRGKSQGAPEIKGFSGRLGFNVRPNRTKVFPIVLIPLDAKAEFRNSSAEFPHLYSVGVTIKGPGGLEIKGATTLMLGDFGKCGEGAVPTSYCNPF